MFESTATLKEIAGNPAVSDNPLNPIAEIYADEMLDNMRQTGLDHEEHLSAKLLNGEAPFLFMSIVHAEIEEPMMPRLDERLRVFRPIDCKTYWAGCTEVGELHCELCGTRFHVGDHWRWLNVPEDSPARNFTVCEACSTADAVERYTSACLQTVTM